MSLYKKRAPPQRLTCHRKPGKQKKHIRESSLSCWTPRGSNLMGLHCIYLLYELQPSLADGSCSELQSAIIFFIDDSLSSFKERVQTNLLTNCGVQSPWHWASLVPRRRSCICHHLATVVLCGGNILYHFFTLVHCTLDFL